MRVSVKKGQVSIFMVIAILLLILASFLIYVQKYAITRQSELQMRGGQNIEDDIASLNEYVDSVARSSVYKALVLWANSSGIANATISGIPFEECTFEGRRQDLAYLYDGAVGYFDPDGNNEPEKDRLRNNLSFLTASFFRESLDLGVFDEKGMDIDDRSLSNAEVLSQFNEFTSLFVLSSHLKVSKGGFATTFPQTSIEENVSMRLIEEELPFVIEWIGSSDNFEGYSPSHDKISVCGYSAKDECIDPFGGAGSNNAHRVTITLDESLGETYPLRFEFLVDRAIDGCSI